MKILDKLHKIEKAKCIYNIHYCKAGIGFVFWDRKKVKSAKNWRDGLTIEKYYPTFEEAVEAEFNKLNSNKGKK